jgi:hypothetical protein
MLQMDELRRSLNCVINALEAFLHGKGRWGVLAVLIGYLKAAATGTLKFCQIDGRGLFNQAYVMRNRVRSENVEWRLYSFESSLAT